MIKLEVGHVVRERARPNQKGNVRFLREGNIVVMWADLSRKDCVMWPSDLEVQVREGRHLVWKQAC